MLNVPFYQNLMLLPVTASHTALGVMGELLVVRLLIERGYRLIQTHRIGDVTVADRDGEIHHVEVKTARRDKEGAWQFCLYKRGHTDYRGSDWVVLLLVLANETVAAFVVPAGDLHAQKVKFGTAPGAYKGRLAKYHQSIRALELVCK